MERETNTWSATPFTAALIGLLALYALGNGGWMVISPQGWYATVPGVTHTGPFNPHFILDIGFIYLATGAMLGAALVWRRHAVPLVAGSAVWVVLHAGLHVIELGHGSAGHASAEAAGVVAPAFLHISIALRLMSQEKGESHAEEVAPEQDQRVRAQDGVR